MISAALFVLCGANALAMVVMNAGTLPGTALPGVYGAALVAATLLALQLWGSFPRFDECMAGKAWRRLLLPLLAVTFVLLLAPRAVYLSEPFTGFCIDPVCWDDFWHIQEITALTDAPAFPVRAPDQPDKWLSSYYATWMLPATLWHLLPAAWKTVKIALFIGWIVTAGLSLAFLVVAASRAAASRAAFAMLLYLVFWQCGTRSCFVFSEPLASHEWWMERVGSTLGLGTVASASIWAVHHLVSAAAVLLAVLIGDAFLTSGRGRPLFVVLGTGLLMASAVLGSLFTVIGALPLLGWWIARHGRAGARFAGLTAAVATTVVLPVLWLFLGREITLRAIWGGVLPGVVNAWPPSYIYIIILYYLLILADVGLPLIAVFIRPDTADRRKLREGSRVVPWAVTALAIPFFLISQGTSNNLALRGTLLPILALMPAAASLLAPYLRRLPFLLLAAVLALGTASEIATCWARAIQSLRPDPSTRSLRAGLLRLNLGLIRPDEEGSSRFSGIPSAAIGAAATGRVADPNAGAMVPAWGALRMAFGSTASFSARLDAALDRRLRYLAERRLPPARNSDGRLRPLPLAALELANDGPFGPWAWQRK
ncbi:MAG TPA: hypothetical protein VIV61_01825 [Candidatus Ozemobacteraceae bacterium]